MLIGKRKGWIGIDIGTCAIKLAQVERRGQQYSVFAAAVIDRTNILDTQQWLRSAPASSASEIGSAVKSASFKGRDTACAPPFSVCDLRTMEVPYSADSESRQFISEQLSQIHSIPSENVHFDFWRNATGGTDDDVNVLCLADRWTTRIMEDHMSAGLTCNVLDGLPQTLARACCLMPDYRSDIPYAVLDWGYSNATFCVVLSGQPIFTRCLTQHGFRGYESKIAEALGMNRSDTRRIVRRFGVPQDKSQCDDEIQLTVSEIINGDCEQLVQELLRTISFFRTQQSNLELETGVVFGAGGMLKNVGSWLGEKLSLAMQTWALAGDSRDSSDDTVWPIPLLGPAIASSALIWEM